MTHWQQNKLLCIAVATAVSFTTLSGFAIQSASHNPDQAYGSVQPHPVLDSDGNVTSDTEKTTLLTTSDAVLRTWISGSDGVDLYSDYGCTNIIGTAKFLEEFYQVWESVDTVLLAKSEAPKFDSQAPGSGHADRIAGYSKKSNFVQSRPGDPAYYCEMTESNIASKALTVHKWEDNETSERAKVLNAPSDSAEELDTIQLYQINYVYLTHGVDPDNPTEPLYYLVGRTPYVMRGSSEIQSGIRGWITSKRIFNWDHRQAVEFNKDPDASEWRIQNDLPIQFYGSPENAIAGGDALYKEDLTKKKWPHYLPRYPIIENVDEDQHIIRAGVIGDSFSGDHKIEVGIETLIQQKLEEVQKERKNVDILLVIDATGSMEMFYRSIGNSIDYIQAAIQKNGLTARYAASYYRDYAEDQKLDSWSHYYQDFRGAAEFRELFDKTSPSHISSAGGESDPCTFAGIINGINSVSWDEGSSRVVILIGDQGNTTSTVTNTFENQITIDPDLAPYMAADAQGNDLDKTMRTMEQFGIDMFFAIQTKADMLRDPSLVYTPDPMFNKFFRWRLREFNNQSRMIQQRLGIEEMIDVIDAYGSDLTEQITVATGAFNVRVKALLHTLQLLKEGKSLDDAVLESLKLMGLSINKEGSQFVNYDGGPWGLNIGKGAIDAAVQKGIDVDLFLQARVQNFAFAYAATQLDQSPYPQLRTTIFMSKNEVETLLAAIGLIERHSMTAENVDRLWRGIVNGLIGEHEDAFTFDEEKPLSEYFSKSLGLPTRSEYLSKSIRELKSLTPQQIAEWNIEIKEKIQVLRNYANDKSIDGTSTEKHVFQKNGFDYLYIPVELFP